MRLKKGLPRLTSSKVASKTFLAMVKQITQIYSGCIVNMILKRENILKTPSDKYILWLWCYQWFSVLNPLDEWVPSALCLQISHEKQKLIKTNRPSHGSWPMLCEGKVLWQTTTKIKVSFTKKKVLYFKESFTFQSKCCILKKTIVLNRKFYISKRKY